MNVIIVDDEREACNSLRKILTEYIDIPVNITGVAYNTREAEQLIKQFKPDAIFLDIEMPEESAFDFLERITPFYFDVIFVTAYDEYAVRAFRLNAVDYILKPIDIDEVKRAIARLKERLQYKVAIKYNNTVYQNLLSHVKTNHVSKIFFRENNNIEIVQFSDLIYIEAQGSYSRVTFLKQDRAKQLIMSHSIAEYEQMLPSEIFYRVHKSYIINCTHITKIIKNENPTVLVHEQYSLPISRRRYTDMMHFLKRNFFNAYE